jgi:hypothetical protein
MMVNPNNNNRKKYKFTYCYKQLFVTIFISTTSFFLYGIIGNVVPTLGFKKVISVIQKTFKLTF